MNFSTIILAAGQGTRFKSKIPKPLHEIAGKPMLQWVIDLSKETGSNDIITVIPKNSKPLEKWLTNQNYVIQETPMGTGHAVSCCKQFLKKTTNDIVLILYADTPLIEKKTILNLLNLFNNGSEICILGSETNKPKGYGRLIKSSESKISEIIEEKEATPLQKNITLINGGILAAKKSLLLDLLPKITKKNGEFYLTDLVKLSNNINKSASFILTDINQLLGVNDREQLAEAENYIQKILRTKAMLSGVTLRSPETIFLSSNTVFEQDVTIEPNVFIGQNVYLSEGTVVKSFSHLEGIKSGINTTIGPFARLRPGTILNENTKIGNFVEIKNSTLDKNTKVGHLSYIGDSEIGKDVNVGAGTITCNFDGEKKHKTKIGNNSFVGSNVSIVAPLTIGKNSLIGAGSTITEDVGDDILSIERSKQIHKKNVKKKF